MRVRERMPKWLDEIFDGNIEGYIKRSAVRLGIQWADENPNWIDVNDGLPEKLEGENFSDWVYVTDGTSVMVCRYLFDRKIQVWQDNLMMTSHYGITHWMPIILPKKD